MVPVRLWKIEPEVCIVMVACICTDIFEHVARVAQFLVQKRPVPSLPIQFGDGIAKQHDFCGGDEIRGRKCRQK